jgi:small subunit ribosomal protein S11
MSEEIKDNKLEETNQEVKEENLEESKEAKKKDYKERKATLHIYTSFNNTILHLADVSGRTIIKVRGGNVTKHSRLKANPTVAMFAAKKVAESAKEHKITSLYIKVRAQTGNPAPGPGAHAVVKSLTKDGIKILSITDMTRVPRGGPKKKGGRRGRRV